MSRNVVTGAKQRLMTEMKALQKETWINFDDIDGEINLLKWRFALLVPNPDSVFHGGYLRAEMVFSNEYPYQPPKFRFLIPITHPNVYPDGALCISILHKPGEDLMSGEEASERWSPLQGAESVLRSVLLLLDDPEINSPANVDASVLYRDRRSEYNEKARDSVHRSLKDVPEGFQMPSTFDQAPPPKPENDEAFWHEEDGELDLDFGGSDTGDDSDGDQEMQDFEDDEDGDQEFTDGDEDDEDEEK